MSGLIKFTKPQPMKPKKIGKCCVCKPKGMVWADDKRFPSIGKCDRCGIVHSFHIITIRISDEDLEQLIHPKADEREGKS